jgi:hypothetical protein
MGLEQRNVNYEIRNNKSVKKCTPVEYTYFPNMSFGILHTSMALIFIYCVCVCVWERWGEVQTKIFIAVLETCDSGWNFMLHTKVYANGDVSLFWLLKDYHTKLTTKVM